MVGPPDSSGDFQWTYNDASHTSITETYKGSNLFSLSLDSATGNYTATMLGTIPSTQVPLDPNNIKAGGPINTLQVGTTNGSGDYVLISASSTVGAGLVKASSGNVGVDNGNLDPNETLIFKLFDSANTQIKLEGIDIGTKSAQSAMYDWVAKLNDGTVIASGSESVVKNGTIHVDTGGSLFDVLYITKDNGDATKIGLGSIDLLIQPQDVTLNFTAQLTDGDGDHTSQNFAVSIDGNNDGSITNPISAAAAINMSSTLMASTTDTSLMSPLHHQDYMLL